MICIDVLYIDLNTTSFQHLPKATEEGMLNYKASQ